MAVRYRTPFAPEFNFIVKRPFTIDGREYAVGEEFDKANVNDRLLKKLYDQHKLDAVIPSFTIRKDAEEPDGDVAPPVKEPPAKSRVKEAAPAVEAVSPAEPSGEKPKYWLEPSFKSVKLMSATGEVGKYKTKEEAEAALAALLEAEK